MVTVMEKFKIYQNRLFAASSARVPEVFYLGVSINGATQQLDGFCEGNSDLEMDDN